MNLISIILQFISSLYLYAAVDATVTNTVIKLPPPGAPATSIAMNIKNNSDKDIKLIEASGDFAKTFEIHTMEMTDGMMKMRKVDGIEIKKNSSVTLESGGYHIMVFGIKKPLEENQTVKLKLKFENHEEELEVKAKVLSPMGEHGHRHHH